MFNTSYTVWQTSDGLCFDIMFDVCRLYDDDTSRSAVGCDFEEQQSLKLTWSRFYELMDWIMTDVYGDV